MVSVLDKDAAKAAALQFSACLNAMCVKARYVGITRPYTGAERPWVITVGVGPETDQTPTVYAGFRVVRRESPKLMEEIPDVETTNGDVYRM